MATPYRISLGPQDLGNFHRQGSDPVNTSYGSALLQRNLESFDIVFRGSRHSMYLERLLIASLTISCFKIEAYNSYLDHIVHYLLTLYALGAKPDEMKQAFDREAAYQRPRFPIDHNVVETLSAKDSFALCLGQQQHYSNFLRFFQDEIAAKGVKRTLGEHIFADTEHATRMLPRFFTSQ